VGNGLGNGIPDGIHRALPAAVLQHPMESAERRIVTNHRTNQKYILITL
jgi:hypothetical protein